MSYDQGQTCHQRFFTCPEKACAFDNRTDAASGTWELELVGALQLPDLPLEPARQELLIAGLQESGIQSHAALKRFIERVLEWIMLLIKGVFVAGTRMVPKPAGQ